MGYEKGGLCSLFIEEPVSGAVPPQLASLRCELQPPPRRTGETSHSRHVGCGPPRSTTPTSSSSSQLSDPLNTGCEREGTWLRERPTPAGAKRVRPSCCCRCSRYGSGASSDHGHELALVLRPSASATGDNDNSQTLGRKSLRLHSCSRDMTLNSKLQRLSHQYVHFPPSLARELPQTADRASSRDPPGHPPEVQPGGAQSTLKGGRTSTHPEIAQGTPREYNRAVPGAH